MRFSKYFFYLLLSNINGIKTQNDCCHVRSVWLACLSLNNYALCVPRENTSTLVITYSRPGNDGFIDKSKTHKLRIRSIPKLWWLRKTNYFLKGRDASSHGDKSRNTFCCHGDKAVQWCCAVSCVIKYWIHYRLQLLRQRR